MEMGTEQDDYEFETILDQIPNMTSGILGEIPSVRSGNQYSEESIHKNSGERRNFSSPPSFDEFNSDLQPWHTGNSAALYDFSSLGRSSTASLNSSGCPFDQKSQTNDNLDGGYIFFENDGVSSIENTDEENFFLPEIKSLTSAFRQLSFTDGVRIEVMKSQPTNHKISPDCTSILEGQQLNDLANPLSRLDSTSMTITSPESPGTFNGEATINRSSMCPCTFNGKAAINPSSNSLETLNVALDGEESAKFLKRDTQEPKKQKPWSFQSLEKFSGDFVEKQQFLPVVYSGAMPLHPSTNPFHVIPGIYDPGRDFSYQRLQPFLETHSNLPFMQPPHICQSDVAQKQMEDEWYLKQQYLHLQHHWHQGLEPHHMIQANADVTIEPITRNDTEKYFKMPLSHQLEQTNQDLFCSNASVLTGVKPSELTLTSNALCHYYAQGFCGRGKSCPFAHVQKQTSPSSFGTSTCFHENSDAVQLVNKVGKCSFPEKILTRSQGLNSPKTMKPAFSEVNGSHNHGSINGKMFLNDHFPLRSTFKAGIFQSDVHTLQEFPTTSAGHHINNLRLQRQKYCSSGEFMGRVYPMAKDQYGCRFLQRKLAEGNAEDIDKIFIEVIDHIVELMVDPFGNYLVQKLLEVCSENQRMHILHAITRKPGDLVRISLDGHGTRAVQKIIETINTPEHFSMVFSSLKPGILILMKDSNGSHVVQRCLKYSMPQCHKFIFEAAIAHCVELGTDRHGCCVLQKCLSHSDGEQKQHLLYNVTSNALILSQDQFGNYVVQYVFELQIPWAIAVVLNQLVGSYGSLSMQKYSSHVVERCLRYAEVHCSQIVLELVNNSQLDQILQDPYGNYVIQVALDLSKGASHAALVEAIRPHIPALRTSPYGKKVLSNKSLKK